MWFADKINTVHCLPLLPYDFFVASVFMCIQNKFIFYLKKQKSETSLVWSTVRLCDLINQDGEIYSKCRGYGSFGSNLEVNGIRIKNTFGLLCVICWLWTNHRGTIIVHIFSKRKINNWTVQCQWSHFVVHCRLLQKCANKTHWKGNSSIKLVFIHLFDLKCLGSLNKIRGMQIIDVFMPLFISAYLVYAVPLISI